METNKKTAESARTETAAKTPTSTKVYTTKKEKSTDLKILKRLDAIPQKYRNIYIKAFSGKASPRQAIKAFCLECVYWQKEEIRKCTCPACPLYRLRPYQQSASLPRQALERATRAKRKLGDTITGKNK